MTKNNNKLKNLKYALGFGALSILASCGTSNYVSENVHIPKESVELMPSEEIQKLETIRTYVVKEADSTSIHGDTATYFKTIPEITVTQWKASEKDKKQVVEYEKDYSITLKVHEISGKETVEKIVQQYDISNLGRINQVEEFDVSYPVTLNTNDAEKDIVKGHRYLLSGIGGSSINDISESKDYENVSKQGKHFIDAVFWKAKTEEIISDYKAENDIVDPVETYDNNTNTNTNTNTNSNGGFNLRDN